MIDSGFDKLKFKILKVNLRYTQISEIFHQIFQFTPSNFSYWINFTSTIYICKKFCSWMFKNEVIDRYMQCIIQNFEIHLNAQVCICSLADLNIGQCVELTFFEGKLGGFLVTRV